VPLLHRVVAEQTATDIGLLFYRTCHDAAATTIDMRRLTTGIRSEKCVVKRFRLCGNVIDSLAYYTLRLYGTAYCF
jgi:hypothetical protein